MKNAVIGVLKYAGRYEDVIQYLNEVKTHINTGTSYPVALQFDPAGNGELISRVSGKIICEGVNAALKMLTDEHVFDGMDTNDMRACETEIRSLQTLSIYIESSYKIDLHNYAISDSHRHYDHDPSVMERIRVMMVTNSAIDEIAETILAIIEDDVSVDVIGQEFYVPEGWKAQEADKDIRCIHEATPAEILDDVIKKLIHVQNQLQ